jgi:large subunit ribosomal protein L19
MSVVETQNKEITQFNPGDTIKVHYRIVEGDKSRVQPFEGIVISKKGTGASKTFTVRRIGADSIGVERIFPLYSPNIEKIEVVSYGKVRRAKLYYLRNRIGKAATKIKTKLVKK